MLRQELQPEIPLVVGLARKHGVTRLIRTAGPGSTLAGVDVFPQLDRVCTMEFVKGGSFERIAVAIHRRWRAAQLAADKPAPSWDDLDESSKESSRAQARDIPVKLAKIGCSIAPLRDWAASEFAFTAVEVEKLAIAEHDRWIDERIRDGWRSGPMDPVRKTTPYLVPFTDLPPDIAEYDRIFVRAIPSLLASVGLQIMRVAKA